MKIGLIDVDGKGFPNLALMKISAYHKAQGHFVEWMGDIEYYDYVYMSKIFTFTPDYNRIIAAAHIVRGGTGYNFNNLPIEIENTNPDYSLYYRCRNEAYGFLTRGCIRKCPWCIVPKKEGSIQPYDAIENILQGRKSAILMDNNILACDYGIKQLEKIADLKCRVDFNQGLDARLVSDEIAKLLSRIKWIRFIRFACDSPNMLLSLETVIKYLKKYNIPMSKIYCYVLLSDDMEESYSRVEFCRSLGITPFAQPYRDFTPTQKIPKWQKDMARWCNHKAIFKTVDFKDYIPRQGFKCSEYFKTK